MIYVMSDLHGCYDKYKQMLEKIKFGHKDTLYILGDVIDRGDDGIKILLDMMKRPNIIPILGNHEYMAYCVLKKLNVEITESNVDNYLDIETMQIYENWIFNGGITTSREFTKLDRDLREDILDYLREFEIYEELEVGGKKFLLVHGGLANFSEEKLPEEYSIDEIVWGRCDYARRYYSDKYLVTGHTPTYNIDEKYKGKIYVANNHIAIDCGVVSIGRLGCICLDNMKEFYV